MTDDVWADLAEPFVDGAYESAKGRIRTFVLHRQLIEQLCPPPAHILDVGAGAGHQSLPLARAGYRVTLLDSSAAMLEKAEQRLAREQAAVRARVDIVHAAGENAEAATGGRRFDAVLCHGVLMYQQDPEPLLAALCARLVPGGLLSLMALNPRTLAIRPALQRRWAEALAAFDAQGETGVLGVPTRADTVDDLSLRLLRHGVEPVTWYGVWLFADWVDVEADTDSDEVAAMAQVELRAARQDPYRAMSRVFHLIGRRGEHEPGQRASTVDARRE